MRRTNAAAHERRGLRAVLVAHCVAQIYGYNNPL